ncbi:MAG: glycosyltransferase family 4 protein [Candidatus Gribaldobacteria bacterium]|nr:glycosyltransferase family 4 protein [Candidatus Gribaldobacteria bacterium]
MAIKPKIVILCSSYAPFISGAEAFIKETVERLQNNYDFVVLTARFKKQLAKQEQQDGCLIKRMGFGLPFGLDKFYFMIFSPFLAVKLKPAIAHGVMESYAGVALIILRWLNKKIPSILTLQCGDLDHPKKQKKIPKWLWRKIHTTPDYITAISSFLAKRAERLRKSKENIFIIPNGFDVNELPRKEKVFENRIVCVARLSWEKGIEYLIKALPEICQQFPYAHLVIVGDGPEKENLGNLTEKLGLSEAVFFRGFLPHQEALKEISQGEVFVCPSLAEGLGNVFLEAQACNTPVIGANVGGIPDIIQDGFNGFLIQPKNSQVIVGAVIKIFSDKNLAQQLAQNGQTTVQKFAWPNIVSQVDNLYQKILHQ